MLVGLEVVLVVLVVWVVLEMAPLCWANYNCLIAKEFKTKKEKIRGVIKTSFF